MKQSKRYTLVIDLDETFINSATESAHEEQIYNGIINPDNAYLFGTYIIRLRNGVFEFIEKAKDKFNLIIFTAAKRSYANFVYNILDPNKKIFQKVYARENCTITNGCFQKDMTLIDEDVTKIILIDNNKDVFISGQYGLHVRDFKGHDDNEMRNLWNCLEKLYTHGKMHTIIHKVSKTHNLHIKDKLYQERTIDIFRKRYFSLLQSSTIDIIRKIPPFKSNTVPIEIKSDE